jgi:hypothetical protein
LRLCTKVQTPLAIKYMEDTDYPGPEFDWNIDETMANQIELEKKIEAYEKIEEDVRNSVIPF